MADTQKGHEGEKLRLLLSEAGLRPADLARAAQVTQTSVGRYLSSEKLGAKAWETATRGLAALGLDPNKIRATAVVITTPASPGIHSSHGVSLRARESPEDLRPLIQHFSRKHLEALRQILEASPDAQFILKVVIDDRLERET